MKTVMPNGQMIEHTDVIYSNIVIKLDFMDRIRVLFGREIYTTLELYTTDTVTTVGSMGRTRVAPIFPNRRPQKCMEAVIDQQIKPIDNEPV